MRYLVTNFAYGAGPYLKRKARFLEFIGKLR